MAASPAFRLFGFPIHVRGGFLLFLALVVFVNGGELGLWIAGSAAVLTLLHELGHAVAARATGARAEISLDFLAGYASFVPTRPLARWERAGISIAGPAVQIGIGIGVLLLIGVSPFDPDTFRGNEAAIAIWWTGPMMGLFNLFPVLPLDGGHIVLAGLDRVIPGRSHTVMLYLSIAISATVAVVLFTSERYRGLGLFALLPILAQVQMLNARRPADRPHSSAGPLGEAHAWLTGDVTAIPPPLVPSPWFRAAQQLDQGHPDVARGVLLADLADDGPPDWWPPVTAPPDRLAALVALLPRPLPAGRPYSELALAGVLLRIGAAEDAARYGADSFARHPSTATAVVVARAAATLGDTETAFGWLRAAYHADTEPESLAHALERAPELVALRGDERYVSLQRQLSED